MELTSSTTFFGGTLVPLVLLPDRYSECLMSLEVTCCAGANDQHMVLENRLACFAQNQVGKGADRLSYQNEAI